MSNPLLEIKSLTKKFPIFSGVFRSHVDDFIAVENVSLQVPQRGILGLVGESGSGKSTVARCAIRLLEPSEGYISFAGENVLSFPKERLQQYRKEVQMIFQDPYSSLNPRKTLGESVGEGLRYYRMIHSKSELFDRVAEIFDSIGLSRDMIKRYPHEISGGQQQRVCVGRAIAMQPKLIICDEAVSALDISVQAQILNLLMQLKEEFGLSYLFISHDLSVVRYFCDDVVVMKEGHVVETGEANFVFDSPKETYTKQLMNAIPKAHPRDR